MYQSCTDKETYITRIDRLKRENLEEISRAHDHLDRRNFIKAMKGGQFHEAGKLATKHLRWLMGEGKKKRFAQLRAKLGPAKKKGTEKPAPNYFSEEAIAVYTVIFGDYDDLLEPRCCPDNCRFFMIGDRTRIPENSVWEYFELPEEIQTRISGMNNTEKNRFLKMMPHLLFPDFNYSVYLDGNIRMVTDPTEFINRMPESGFSAHRHVSRDCVYEEARAVIELKKAPKEKIEELVQFLRREKMPAHYGLPECPVLVRRHRQPECVRLMEEWWKLFERFPYRDQLLLPLVLFENGIRTEEIARLGKNVRHCTSFRRYTHPEK